MDVDQDREWLSVAQAAQRMDVTEDEIIRLARARVLRSRNLFGIPEVEPAIVAGVRRNPAPDVQTKRPLFPWRDTQPDDEHTDDSPTW